MTRRLTLLLLLVMVGACGSSSDTTAVTPGPFADVAGIYTARTVYGGAPLPCEIKLSAPIGGGLQFYDFLLDARITLYEDGHWSEVAHNRFYSGTPGNDERIITTNNAGTFEKTVGGNPGDYTLRDTLNGSSLMFWDVITFIAPDRFNHYNHCQMVYQR